MRSEGSPKKCMSGTCDPPSYVWGQKVGVLVAFINPADGKVPKFFKASGMLVCNGNTEQIAL